MYTFMVIQSLRAFRWAELRGRSLVGVEGVLGVPGRRGGYLGGPRGSWGRAWEAPKQQKVFAGCLGGVKGLPWGDFGRGGGPWERLVRWKC